MLIYSFKTTCISQGFSNTGKTTAFEEGTLRRQFKYIFWHHIVIGFEHVLLTMETFNYIYDGCIAFFTMYSFVTLPHEVIRP